MAVTGAQAPLASRLLDELLRAAGEPPAGDDVRFTGADPVLPSVFPLGEAGAAVIAACALLAARIWEVRTAEPQGVSVAVDAAAAALRSARYLRAEPSPASGRPRLPGLGVYRTRDGRWIYFQRLFEHHRTRLSQVLGCPLDEDAIRHAVNRRDAFALEQAVNEAGACAGVVRTRAEWEALGQAREVAATPLLQIRRTAEGPALPLPSGPRPLSGLRVLDVTRVLAGPTSTRTLAEHGADVLRISHPELPDHPGMSRDTGHGKRSARLDLASPAGAATLRGLLRSADVFVGGYRPGALERLGFGAEELARLRPGIVTVSVTAFGAAGPWRERRGFDSVVQAVDGLAASHTGTGFAAVGGGLPPVFLPANPLDYMTGYLAAFGVLGALRRRAEEGGSYQVDVSLARTGEWLWQQPRSSREDAGSAPSELPRARLDELMIARETPYGRLAYLAPAARLERTPGRWDLPTPAEGGPCWEH